MRAGARSHRLTIWRAATAVDELGQRFSEWYELATLWAERRPVSDGERDRAGQLGAFRTDRFRIDAPSGAAWADLSAQDQLELDGRRYAIEGVKPLEREGGLEITASAKADA
jgi:SPP1 family predicted phage head-tail adaptor